MKKHCLEFHWHQIKFTAKFFFANLFFKIDWSINFIEICNYERIKSSVNTENKFMSTLLSYHKWRNANINYVNKVSSIKLIKFSRALIVDKLDEQSENNKSYFWEE
jgi:hypothetical protein